jgi:hypothetical protein
MMPAVGPWRFNFLGYPLGWRWHWHCGGALACARC